MSLRAGDVKHRREQHQSWLDVGAVPELDIDIGTRLVLLAIGNYLHKNFKMTALSKNEGTESPPVQYTTGLRSYQGYRS